MIGWFKRWRARRVQQAKNEACQRDGHLLMRSGEMTPGKMVGGAGVPIGKPEFGLYSCKCGYGEINELDMIPYRRPWDEGEQLKAEARKVV